jgi:hypothetical protein
VFTKCIICGLLLAMLVDQVFLELVFLGSLQFLEVCSVVRKTIVGSEDCLIFSFSLTGDVKSRASSFSSSGLSFWPTFNLMSGADPAIPCGESSALRESLKTCCAR